MLQAVRHCRRWASAPGAARLVFMLVFIIFVYFTKCHIIENRLFPNNISVNKLSSNLKNKLLIVLIFQMKIYSSVCLHHQHFYSTGQINLRLHTDCNFYHKIPKYWWCACQAKPSQAPAKALLAGLASLNFTWSSHPPPPGKVYFSPSSNQISKVERT